MLSTWSPRTVRARVRSGRRSTKGRRGGAALGGGHRPYGARGGTRCCTRSRTDGGAGQGGGFAQQGGGLGGGASLGAVVLCAVPQAVAVSPASTRAIMRFRTAGAPPPWLLCGRAPGRGRRLAGCGRRGLGRPARTPPRPRGPGREQRPGGWRRPPPGGRPGRRRRPPPFQSAGVGEEGSGPADPVVRPVEVLRLMQGSKRSRTRGRDRS